MDIKDQVNEVFRLMKKDPEIVEKFKADPAGTIESLLGADLPDGAIQHVVGGVKAKLASKEAGGLLDKLKKIIK